MTPPGRASLAWSAPNASPTVSKTPSTRAGRRVPGSEHLMRTQTGGEGVLLLCAAGDPDNHSGGPAQLDQRRRDSPRSALDEHPLARPQSRLDEEHAVGGEPRRDALCLSGMTATATRA